VIISGCVALASVTAGQAADTPNASTKQLSHAELVDLLAGGARFRALPLGAGLGASRREYFRSTGEYEGCGPELEIFGKFTVKRDALCVATKDATVCREVLRSPTGDYFERFGAARTLLRVEISKSKAETCRTIGVTP